MLIRIAHTRPLLVAPAVEWVARVRGLFFGEGEVGVGLLEETGGICDSKSQSREHLAGTCQIAGCLVEVYG